MGPRWRGVPESVRRTHRPGEWRGFMRVTWGEGFIARQLARRLGLPAPSPRLAVTLDVRPVEEGLRWTRRMGSVVLTSTHAVANGLLLESFGPWEFAFCLLPAASGVHYAQQYFAVRIGRLRLRLFDWSSPHVVARVMQAADGVITQVDVTAPGLGRLLRYEGVIEPVRAKAAP